MLQSMGSQKSRTRLSKCTELNCTVLYLAIFLNNVSFFFSTESVSSFFLGLYGILVNLSIFY